MISGLNEMKQTFCCLVGGFHEFLALAGGQCVAYKEVCAWNDFFLKKNDRCSYIYKKISE